MIAKEVLKCLQERFCPPEWLFASEITLGIGVGRRADAVALNCVCWGEFGMSFIGFEIKVSRGDLLQELKDPKKREETYYGTDALFLVTPRKLCDVRELPDDVGLIECAVNGDKTWTRIKKRPKEKKLPMAYCEKYTDHPYYGKILTKDFTVIPPIKREVATAFIRSFNPSRINKGQIFKNIELERQNQELKSKLRNIKWEVREDFVKHCSKNGVSGWNMLRETFCC